METIIQIIIFLNNYSGVLGVFSTIGLFLFLAYNNQEKDDISIEIEFKSNNESSEIFENNIIIGSYISLHEKAEEQFTVNFFISAENKSITHIRAYTYELDQNKLEEVVKNEIPIEKENTKIKPGEYIKVTTVVPEIYTRYGLKFKINGYETGYKFTTQGKNSAVPKYLTGRQSLLGIIKLKLMS